VKFRTLTPKIWQYYHLQLHRIITTAVYSAAPVPEIMDTPLYYIVSQPRRPLSEPYWVPLLLS
jgi:hypothetical protein